MKNLIIYLFIVSLIKLSESACSINSFSAIQKYDGTKVLGRWYTTSSYSNGNDKSECLWLELIFAPNHRNAVTETQNRVYNNKTSKRRQTAIITLVEPNRDPPEGVVDVQFINGVHMIKYIPVIEYNEYALVRACYKGEGIFF